MRIEQAARQIREHDRQFLQKRSKRRTLAPEHRDAPARPARPVTVPGVGARRPVDPGRVEPPEQHRAERVDGEELVVTAAEGEGAADALGSRSPAGGWLSGDAVQSGAPVALPQAGEDERLRALDPRLDVEVCYYEVPRDLRIQRA